MSDVASAHLAEASELSFRPATAADATVVAPLLRDAIGEYTFFFGTDDPTVIDRDLARMFAHPNNRFSHRWALVAEVAGEVGGVMISYPHEVLRRLFVPTGWLLLRTLGPWRFFKGIVLNFDRLTGKESEPGEYHGYICAVSQDFRRMGLGRAFVDQAERMAREGGYDKVSCTADPSQKAIPAAQARGYEIAETIEVRDGVTYHRFLRDITKDGPGDKGTD